MNRLLSLGTLLGCVAVVIADLLSPREFDPCLDLDEWPGT